VAVAEAEAEVEVEEALTTDEETEEETALELGRTAVAVDRTEETAEVAVEVELSTVSTTVGGKVVLVASYPLEPVITTLKSLRHPPAFRAVAASRLLPQRVHLKFVMLEGVGHQ